MEILSLLSSNTPLKLTARRQRRHSGPKSLQRWLGDSGDARQLKELLETYAYEVRAGGAFDFAELIRTLQWLIDNAGCPGCRQGGGPPFCQVKVCAGERGLSVCFECEEFPCSKIDEVADPDTLDRYTRFKELGFDEWLGEQASKAGDGYEIHLRRVPTLRRGSP